jgi:cytidylate kinase
MPGKLDVVTIDGPSGVGKSTVSRRVAQILGYTYLDTGAMYRAVGLFLHEKKVELSDDQAVCAALKNIQIRLLPCTGENDETGVLLNGVDVSAAIRTPAMAMIASQVSALPSVRAKLTALQQEIGAKGKVVAEGRDTGTVVFPAAGHKFFLDAQPEERAMRRIRQLRARGEAVDEQAILMMTIQRDKNDRERAIAPLRQADDALAIDTTCKDVDAVTAEVLEALRK